MKNVIKGLLICSLTFIRTMVFAQNAQAIQSTIKADTVDQNCVNIYAKPDRNISGSLQNYFISLKIPDQSPAPNPTSFISDLIPGMHVIAKDYWDSIGWFHIDYDIYEISEGSAPIGWTNGNEIKIAKVCFNNGPSNVAELIQQIHTTYDGGGHYLRSYWYIDINPGWDYTNFNAPFYATSESTADNGNPNIDDYAYAQTINSVYLPLDLLSFDASLVSGVTRLSWETANEDNTSHFVVQRSLDGKRWTSLGNVIAAGDFVTKNTYGYVDKHPVPGINYYRLQQVDKDGTFKYSLIRNVFVDKTTALFAVQPNPFNNNLFINVNGIEQDRSVTGVKIFTGSGVLAMEQEVKNVSGQILLNCTDLNKGFYVLKLYHGSEILYTEKVIKQ